MYLHYSFSCKKCSEPILFYSEPFGWPSDLPTLSNIMQTGSVAVPCGGRCARVKSYSLLETSPDYAPEGRSVVLSGIEHTEFFRWLECTDSACPFRLPLVSAMYTPLDGKWREDMIARWIWDELRCPAGHLIRNPFNTGSLLRRKPFWKALFS